MDDWCKIAAKYLSGVDVELVSFNKDKSETKEEIALSFPAPSLPKSAARFFSILIVIQNLIRSVVQLPDQGWF